MPSDYRLRLLGSTPRYFAFDGSFSPRREDSLLFWSKAAADLASETLNGLGMTCVVEERDDRPVLMERQKPFDRPFPWEKEE